MSKVVFLAIFLSCIVLISDLQVIISETPLQQGDFLIYKKNSYIYVSANTTKESDLEVYFINDSFPNGTLLVTFIDINNQNNIGSIHSDLQNSTLPLGIPYVSPFLLGKNISYADGSSLIFVKEVDNLYIYCSFSLVQSSTVKGVYYFMSNGLAKNISFYQKDNDTCISKTFIILLESNIINRSLTLPHYHFTIGYTVSIGLNTTLTIYDRIQESIVGVGIISLIIVFIFRKNKFKMY